MTDDRQLRERIHQAVEAYSASAAPTPLLYERVLTKAGQKEPVMKKKLPIAAILVILLLLTSITALALSLTVEEMWKHSFQKMNTTGKIHNLSDETLAEITMDEAIAIARSAIIAKYGTPEAELDAMGVYPTYAARGWDGKTDDYPSEWEVYFSSRTDVDIDLSSLDYGPTGEYRVYINAETKAVTYCHWYTNDFWSRAQVIWDCGSHDEVYWWYRQSGFYEQPIAQQLYWEQQLAGQGYELVHHSAKYKALLRADLLERQFCDPALALDAAADPQAAAAWEMVEKQYGYSAALMQKYCYIVTASGYQTGTDDVFIVYNFELEAALLETGAVDSWNGQMIHLVRHIGSFLVSFDPGTTHCVGVTHLWYTEDHPDVRRITRGRLLEQTDWDKDDLIAFDQAYTELEKAIARMLKVNAHSREMGLVRDAMMRDLGGDPALYSDTMEGYDVHQWFSDKTAPASTPVPSITREEAQAKYGNSPLYWPVEVRYELSHFSNGWLTVPREGELTQAEAQDIALRLLVEKHGQGALDALGDYRVGCTLTRFEGAHGKEVTQWEFYICNDERDEENGWYVRFIDKNREDYGDSWAEVRPFAEVGVG